MISLKNASNSLGKAFREGLHHLVRQISLMALLRPGLSAVVAQKGGTVEVWKLMESERGMLAGNVQDL